MEHGFWGLSPGGTGCPCRCGKLNGGFPPAAPAIPAAVVPEGGLPFWLPVAPAFSFVFAPYPPTPLPQRGSGRLLLYFAGGFAPGTPAVELARRLLALPLWYPAGGVPPALPARRALAVPCGGLPSLSPVSPAFSLLSFPHPPCPRSPSALPGGKGEILGYFMQGASLLASPKLDGTRHLQSLPNRCPGAEPAVCRDTDRSSFPMNSAGSQGEGGPGERNFGV